MLAKIFNVVDYDVDGTRTLSATSLKSPSSGGQKGRASQSSSFFSFFFCARRGRTLCVDGQGRALERFSRPREPLRLIWSLFADVGTARGCCAALRVVIVRRNNPAEEVV